MARNGLSLVPSGKLFFNSDDALAPRDLDHRQDTYEWEEAPPQLISTGSSPFDSSLLGASADGKDAFFFTRDTLVPQDQNGTLAKVYDAREEGGFPFLPDPVRCKASDECHGAGSEAPDALRIGTITGVSSTGGEPGGKKACRKGFVRRSGRCQRRKHRHGKKRNPGRHSTHRGTER
jgi:hypothetical protein